MQQPRYGKMTVLIKEPFIQFIHNEIIVFDLFFVIFNA